MDDLGNVRCAVRFMGEELGTLVDLYSRRVGHQERALKVATHVLFWAFAAQDRLAHGQYRGHHQYAPAVKGTPVLAGLEYARHHATHGAMSLLTFNGPPDLDGPIYEMEWSPLPKLKRAHEDQHQAERDAYDQELLGHSVIDSFKDAWSALNEFVNGLER